MHRLILGFNKMNGVIVGTDYADEQNNPDTRRADLSRPTPIYRPSVAFTISLYFVKLIISHRTKRRKGGFSCSKS